jgi:serine/threonine protein kinase
MTEEESKLLDAQFSSLLDACQEAIAAGAAPPMPDETCASAELRSRVERGVACLHRLQSLRPRTSSSSPSPTDAPTVAATELLASDAALGQRYTLNRLHASGGIGRVWVARDVALGRDIALKELLPERAGSPAVADRFLHEARITGQLAHPGIVPIYELASRSEDGQPFYTMRLIKGRTLTEAARAYHQKRIAGRVEPLEQISLLNAFVSACNTVAYAHSRDVIHRDLKGQNIVLGDYGEVIVLDWGFAKRLQSAEGRFQSAEEVVHESFCTPQSTIPGSVIGTPAYMAPEQALGRLDQTDQRTDVYGLGAILYEILTGRPPFVAWDTQEVLRIWRNASGRRTTLAAPITCSRNVRNTCGVGSGIMSEDCAGVAFPRGKRTLAQSGESCSARTAGA